MAQAEALVFAAAAEQESEPQVWRRRAPELQAEAQVREVWPVSAEPLARRNLAQRAPGARAARGAEPELAARRPEQEQAALQQPDQVAAFAELPELLASQQQAEAPERQRISSEPL